MPSLFSYILQREPGEAGTVFFRFARNSYLRRAVLLLLVLPVDLLWMALAIVRAQITHPPAMRTLLLSQFSPGLVARVRQDAVAYIGPPTMAVTAWQNGGLYIPASPVYVMAAIALLLPARAREAVGHAAIALVQCWFRLLRIQQGVLIHHSDALPFARACVFAARRQGFSTVCLQHGIFHQHGRITEMDGSHSDINVVRSRLDGALIAATAPQSTLCIEPDFFLLNIRRKESISSIPTVKLLGEGWHQCDPAFDKQYLARLRQLESELVACGARVIFRPHPCERHLAAAYGFSALETTPLEESLANADICVGYSSTVLHEAASLSMASVQIDVEGAFRPAMTRDDAAPVYRASSGSQILDSWKNHTAQMEARLSGGKTPEQRHQEAIERVYQTIVQHRTTPPAGATP